MNPIPLLSVVLFSASLSAPPPATVEWVYSMGDAKAQAGSVNKPILVYCWAEGSEYCGKLWQETLSVDDAVVPLGKFVCFSAKHGADGVQKVFERYGVSTLPTMLFLSPQGQAEDLIQGFIPVAELIGELERIRHGEGTVAGLKAAMAKASDGSTEDIEARYALAGKVQALGDQLLHDDMMQSIRAVDPKGKTLIGARVRMQDLVQDIVRRPDYEDGEEQEEETDEQRAERMRRWDLDPLYAHARLVPLAEAKHEAWQQIGNMQVGRRDKQGAFQAFHKAWKTCPEEKVVEWSTDIARWIVENGEEWTSKEKKFALQLAESAMKTLQKRVAAKPPTSEEDQAKHRYYTAYCWNTLAWCRHINGKKGPAIKAAKEALALRDSEEFQADLKKFSES